MISRYTRPPPQPVYVAEPHDWDTRRKRALLQVTLIVFFVVIVFFGIRGSVFGTREDDRSSNCPSRASWMAEPQFLCNNERPVIDKLTEKFALFSVLHLDCLSYPPANMTQIKQLCCAHSRVVFERTQWPFLVQEDGTILRFVIGGMTYAMEAAKEIVCENALENIQCLFFAILSQTRYLTLDNYTSIISNKVTNNNICHTKHGVQARCHNF